MSIRFKILTPMVIISILAASTILFFNVMQFSSFVDNYIEEELERSVLKVQDEIERMKMKSHTAMLYFVNDTELIAAMGRSDQKAVLKRAGELFVQTDVESLTIVDSSATVLARAHNPGLYGDDTSDMPAVRSALEGKSILGAERGVSTNISIRASVPVYNRQGRLLGALFAGDRLDTEKFVDKLKAFTGCEISVFSDDVRVATTLFREDGARATGIRVSGYIEKALMDGDDVTSRTGLRGHEIVARHTPLFSGGGDIIGVVSVGRYLTEKQDMVVSFIMTGLLISLIFMAGSVLVILFVSRQIAEPISQSIGQANYDELTGIFNRRFFEKRLSLLLKTLSRSGGVVSLLMIDIDFFKDYNDTYGHIKGDNCLKAVAEVLTQTMSRADDFVARYGGEEFVAVLPNTDETGARAMAEKLLENMRERGIPHGKNNAADHVTISIGVTSGHVNQALCGIDFIARADFGLYESKRNGRNRYTFTAMAI